MMDSSAVWHNQDPTLSVPSQDDFQQFLDMGINSLGDGLQFDFQDFNQQQGPGVQLMQQDEGQPMDTRMHNAPVHLQQDTTMQEQMPAMTTASHPAIHGPALAHGQSPNDSLSDLDAQIQYLQQQRHQQQQRQLEEQQRNYYAQNRMIPPTPNSIEMHGNNSQFYPQSVPQQNAIYDRYRSQLKEQQNMAFTPLVSPAVTPIDAHFTIPEYTVPGAYFSPLSSPALHAQNDYSCVYNSRHSGTTNSPIDMNSLEGYSALGSSSIVPRKAAKKTTQKQTRPAIRSIRQSPIVKPKRGKKLSSSAIPSHPLGDILEPPDPHDAHSKDAGYSRSTISTEESENGSISPEHLSDMAPPPVPMPGSANRSPYVQAKKAGNRAQALVLGSPATPASLMRLTQSPQGAHAGQDMDVDDSGLDGFALPEPATTTKPQLARLDTTSDGQATPTLASSGAKTPGFQTLPSPAFSRPRSTVSASQSPQIDAMNGGSPVITRKPSMASRSTKKRASSSMLASPALLPRISPSIKPLLPGGGSVSEDTASLLLASKSNYQNILEGTHLPGVSYPMELSTNLTSKRTSHKIAEQGRRNRINSALQEIATLLPKGPAKDSGNEKSGSGEGGEDNETTNGKATSASQSANSKASTVEQAIEYIKSLKQAVEEANKRAEEAERQLKEKEAAAASA